MEKQIKSFQEIKLGDTVFENPEAGGVWDREMGHIIWIGNSQDLINSDYVSWLEQDEEDEEEEIGDYNWVVVQTDMHGQILFNYNCDPCGVVCFKS